MKEAFEIFKKEMLNLDNIVMSGLNSILICDKTRTFALVLRNIDFVLGADGVLRYDKGRLSCQMNKRTLNPFKFEYTLSYNFSDPYYASGNTHVSDLIETCLSNTACKAPLKHFEIWVGGILTDNLLARKNSRSGKVDPDTVIKEGNFKPLESLNIAWQNLLSETEGKYIVSSGNSSYIKGFPAGILKMAETEYDHRFKIGNRHKFYRYSNLYISDIASIRQRRYFYNPQIIENEIEFERYKALNDIT